MSRTKGALGKKTILKLKRLKMYKQSKQKKRGRPKNPPPPVVEPPPVFPMYHYKFLGFCPRCKFMIAKKDLESKLIFKCPSCDKRGRKSALKKQIKTDRPQTKKEFLENTITSEHIDTVGLNDAEINPKHLKINDV